MTALAGIKAVAICKKGTIAGGATNKFLSGFRLKGAMFEISDVETVKDYKNRFIRNKIGFNIKYKSLQSRLMYMKNVHELAKDSVVDCQVVTVIYPFQSENGNEGIFAFRDDKALGIEYELVRNLKENYVEITLNRYYDYATGKTLINEAKANGISPLFVNPDREGNDVNKIVTANVKALLRVAQGTSNGDEIQAVELLDDFEIKIKTKGVKSLIGVAMNSQIDISIKIKGYNSNVNEIQKIIDENIEHDLWIEIPIKKVVLINDVETIVDKAEIYNIRNVLYKGTANINDEKRTVEYEYNITVPINDVVIEENLTTLNEVLTAY